VSVKRKLLICSFLGISAFGATSCGKWFDCLSGKNCDAQNQLENAATADLFVRVVDLSLDSFKGIMAELGLTQAQQDEVAADIKATASQLTSQLALADDDLYNGTMLENLSSMFEDLMEYAITKITQIAPTVDTAKIMIACSVFMNDMIANAGLTGILESLPVEEQVEIATDQATGKLDWEIFRNPLERVASSSFVGKVDASQVGASFMKFKRRPEDRPPPPANVMAYAPTEAEKQVSAARLQALCEGQPADLGRGQGRGAVAASDSLPIPGKGCNGVRIDKKAAFCLFARSESMSICSDTSYGDLASSAKMQSIKIVIDNGEETFSKFDAGKKYDCKVQVDREAVALLVTKVIQAKKPDCSLRVPPPPPALPNRGPGSPPPR
jgi:hypothetical protein